MAVVAKPLVDDADALVCEGYLRKLRGWFANRTRWFRLTATQLSYFEQESGRLYVWGSAIGTTQRSNIASVTDMSGRKFEIKTNQPFGATGYTAMTLEAPSIEVKNRWLRHLRSGLPMDRVFAEGYLNKLQPFGSRSRHRWFELTSKHFAYYDIEAGECMGRCTLDNIERVAVDGDQRFTVRAREPFTKTGAASVRLEAASEQALDRWITSFTLALGTSIVQRNPFSPLPSGERSPDDHFGVRLSAGSCSTVADATHLASEGNRFITNNAL